MKCRGKFKFKGMEKKQAGTFTNNKGDTINYKEKYAVNLDEQTEDGKIYTRTFRIDVDSPLINDLIQLKPYQDITMEFDVNIYPSGSKVIPVALIK